MNVYLGSQIGMYAIVHELGHLIDKRHGTRPSAALIGLRLRASNGLPRYTIPSGDFDVSSFIVSSEGLGGRASADTESAREVWADMFMTAILYGQGIESTGQIPGLIGWTSVYGSANVWYEKFKRAYTIIALRRLMLGGDFPLTTSTEEEKITIISQISRLLNPSIGYDGNDY